MKNNNPTTDNTLDDWIAHRKSKFDEIDITFEVMKSIQTSKQAIKCSEFKSSFWLELPSVFGGIIRNSIVFSIILIPV